MKTRGSGHEPHTCSRDLICGEGSFIMAVETLLENDWERDRLLSNSMGSTYSEASERSPGINDPVDTSSEERTPSMTLLHETAPLLLLGTDTQTPSPIQSWRSVLAELRGPRRLWSVSLFSLFAAFTAILSGYTLAFPSSALLDLRNNMTDSSRIKKGSSLEDIFGVSGGG